jgi:hypothetical protein
MDGRRVPRGLRGPRGLLLQVSSCIRPFAISGSAAA